MPRRRAQPAAALSLDRRQFLRRSGAAAISAGALGSAGAAAWTRTATLTFNCFQQNVVRQFQAVQERLAGEPLAHYVTPVGGGYFFALPGVCGHSDWYGRRLLSA